MKIKSSSVRMGILSAVLAGTLPLAGCADDSGPFGTSQRATIQPAPTGLPNSGIGAPGGASEDTRSIGSIAATEGEATSGVPTAPIGTNSTPIH